MVRKNQFDICMKDIVSKCLLLIGIILWYYFMGCPIKWLTGISCAGCGMTRAVKALLCGDFAMAFYYHPLVYLLPMIVCAYFFRKHINKTLQIISVIAVLVTFMIVYLVRMFSGSDIVNIDLGNGAVFSFLSNICILGGFAKYV